MSIRARAPQCSGADCIDDQPGLVVDALAVDLLLQVETGSVGAGMVVIRGNLEGVRAELISSPARGCSPSGPTRKSWPV